MTSMTRSSSTFPSARTAIVMISTSVEYKNFENRFASSVRCRNKILTGPVKVNDHKLVPPSRASMKESTESLIHHFKIFSEG
ncbi:hypothetical protein BJV78DRAFT_961504 [Lactifluus subvellereus]|nr:hypothetical protein BJV78DRAFT_961504 [Lactifluus subvellereus]